MALPAHDIPSDSALGRILARAGKHRRSGTGYTACCPAHNDKSPSLSISQGDKGVVLHCHAGCDHKRIVEAWSLTESDLFDSPLERGPRKVESVDLTLRELADAKRMNLDALRFYQWADADWYGRPCVTIPYVGRDGSHGRTRLRTALDGDRFKWAKENASIIAYEPDQGALAKAQGYTIVVEGETDTIALLFAGLPALGIPGVKLTHVIERHHVDGLARVFVVREPGLAGDGFVPDVRLRLQALGYSGEVHELRMPDGAKDPCALHARDPETFAAKLAEAMREASEPSKPNYLTLAEMAADCLRPIGKRYQTGFQTLDDATRGGLPLGRLVAILGAPGAGKSTFCAQIAHKMEGQGCAVVYLASDEPADGIITRLGQLEGFSREALESEGAIGDAVRAGFAQRVQGRAIAVIDPDASEDMSTIEDAETALVHLAGDRPRVLIVDSLQTAQCAAADIAESLREKIDAKMGLVKAITKRGALVFVISEMARSGYRSGDRSVDTSALAAGKESGGIEYGVALLLGLRSVKGEGGLVDVEVAKNRLGGAKPEFRLRLDTERASLEETDMPDKETERQNAEEVQRAIVRAKVLEAVRTNHELKSKNAIHEVARGTKSANLKAIDELVKEGALILVNGSFRVAPASRVQ